MSASSYDAHSFVSITKYEIDGNSKKSKTNNVISTSSILAVNLSFRITQDIELVDVQIDGFKLLYLAKMLIELFWKRFNQSEAGD